MKSNKVPLPNPFVIILNNAKDVVSIFTQNSVIDEIFTKCERLNREKPQASPHVALVWNDGAWSDLVNLIPGP